MQNYIKTIINNEKIPLFHLMSLIFFKVNGITMVGNNQTTNGNGIDNISFSGSITIPEFYLGEKVLEIGQRAFFGCTNLKDVKILAKLVSINQRAFIDCLSLERINIPPSVVFIGYASLCMKNSGSAPGILTVSFEGESQLSVAGCLFLAKKHTIILYFCGYGPLSIGTYFLDGVSSFTVYSSTLTSFNGQTTIYGECNEFESESTNNFSSCNAFNCSCFMISYSLINFIIIIYYQQLTTY